MGEEMATHVPRQPRPAVPLRHVGIELRRPHLDEGELGGDEEAVERRQPQTPHEPPAGGDRRVRGRGGGEQEEAHGRLLPTSPGRTPGTPRPAPWDRGCCWPRGKRAAWGLG